MRRTLVALTGALILALTLIPAAAQAAGKARASACDPLDPSSCLLPWPNNRFTVPDVRTDTGRRVNILPGDMPKTAGGRRLDPTDFNRSDGFSPASPILTTVPGLDLRQTASALRLPSIVPVTDLRRSLDRTQPIAVVNARTGTRQLIWAEIASGSRPGRPLLVIHPAKNLSRGGRYVVALGRMRDSRGRLLKPSPAFRAMRDRLKTSDRSLERRRPGFEEQFRTLAKAGLKRRDLYLTWDFTVASTRTITERALALRDNAFAVLGDNNLVDRTVKGGAPRFAIDPAVDFAPCGGDGCQSGENDLLARKVTGVLTVPCYLDRAGCPVGSRFRYEKLKKTANFQANRFVYVPQRLKDNTMQVPFTCIVPRAALTKPSRVVLFGHAAWTDQNDVLRPDVQQLAQEGDMTLCSARQAGIAAEDLPTLRAALGNPDRFAEVVDRQQQGALNSLLLGRLMIHPQGLVTQAAFRTPAGGPAIDTFALYYDTVGAGVLGGVVAALSPDAARASLGTGGMTSSLMLPRSTDFDLVGSEFRKSFRSTTERMLMLSMLQGQWDRADASGYAQSLTQDPLPATPLHTVLLEGAVGDHRIPNVAVEAQARSIEAVKRDPLYDDGRSADLITGYGLVAMSQLELGSVLTMWDGGPVRGALGSPVAPTADVPPTAGADPHDLPAQTLAARQLRSDFLHDDARFVDPCPPTRACRAAGWAY